MSKLIPATVACLLLFTGSANAARWEMRLEHPHHHRRHHVAQVVPEFLTAPVPTQTFTVVNPQAVAPAELQAAEQAVTIQSFAEHHYWGTPVAVWGAGGIQVTLTPDLPPECGALAAGCHDPGWMAVDTGYYFSRYLSHEVLESLVDPSGTGYEVCDPVAGYGYRINGVFVSDFMLPDGQDFLRASHLPQLPPTLGDMYGGL